MNNLVKQGTQNLVIGLSNFRESEIVFYHYLITRPIVVNGTLRAKTW